MKKLIILFFITSFCFSQEPSALFKMDFKNLTKSKDNLLIKYEFVTAKYDTIIDNLFQETPNWVKEELISKIDNTHLYIYIENKFICNPKKGSVISLKVKDKYTNKVMNIFIRISFDLDYGEEIELKNLIFLQGNYFLDMCKSIKKYEITQNDFNTKSCDLQNISRYKIGFKKLNDLIKNHKYINTKT